MGVAAKLEDVDLSAHFIHHIQAPNATFVDDLDGHLLARCHVRRHWGVVIGDRTRGKGTEKGTEKATEMGTEKGKGSGKRVKDPQNYLQSPIREGFIAASHCCMIQTSLRLRTSIESQQSSIFVHGYRVQGSSRHISYLAGDGDVTPQRDIAQPGFQKYVSKYCDTRLKTVYLQRDPK